VLEEYKIEKNDLEGLKEALESVLPRFMQFEAELDAGRLKAKSNCPIHGVYREWCERGCISMRESFVRVISEKIRVRRMHSAPVDKECVFEFSI
jgi:hypothetical protein